MEYEEENEKKTSKFSAGLNIIKRLDKLWINCANFKREGKYLLWNEELDTIWLELARDLEEINDIDSENEKEEGYETKFKKFDNELKDVLPFKDNYKGFQKPTKKDLENRNKQYEILMRKQLFLARLENKIGKGTSWGEQEDDWD